MKIAIDASGTSGGHEVRGVGFHTSELVEHLKKQRLAVEKLIIDEFNFRENRKSLTSGRYDVIHSTFFHPYFVTLPIRHKGAFVATVHDLIYLHYPKQYPPGLRGRLRFILQKSLIKKADAIITISHTSKEDIVEYLKIDSGKVEAIHLAPRSIFKPIKSKSKLERVKKEYNLPDKFVLYVGDVNYNKNLPTLIEACNKLQYNLVIVGREALKIEEEGVDLYSIQGPRDWFRFLFDKPHPELSHYKKLLGLFKDNKRIIRTGFVSDEDLVAIYNLATLYCQPSYIEGFGLTVLEAMACGTPVVSSTATSLKEIAAGAAVYANPKSVGDFSKKIAKVMKSRKLQSQLRKKGIKQASKFSWDKTAKETVKVYQRAVKGKKEKKSMFEKLKR
jgi:glycosyltransferase involved in cell wall biosynthesis